VSGEPTKFGIERAELRPEREGGASDTQAGEHPFQLTTTLHFNEVTEFNPHKEKVERSVPALAKDVQFRLPPGMIGNPLALPSCSEVDFTAVFKAKNQCRPETVAGVAVVTINEPKESGVLTRAVPVFNLTPAVGEPARFGFFVIHDMVVLDTSVKTGEDYGVTVSVNNASEVAKVLSSQVTLWGVPGDESHDESRGWGCVEAGIDGTESEPCTKPATRNGSPFLTLPTTCTGALQTTAFADSWAERGALLPDGRLDESDPRWTRATSSLPTQEGCEKLPFFPSIALEPETQAGSTPTGFAARVEVPQGPTLTASELAEATARSTTFALPVGMELNAGAADGLVPACSAAQMGFLGSEEANQTNNHEFSPAQPSCPDAAKVGTVTVHTPLLSHNLVGSAYLSNQDTNPFAPPLVLYLVAFDKESGVLVKLAGKVTPDPNTGQLVSVFEETPPVPFEQLEVKFFNGPRSSVTTPPICGNYTATSSITPWSSATPVSPSSQPFSITSGPGGVPCANPQPFAPGFGADASSPQAGGFTNFTVDLARPDADQALSTVTMHLPVGEAAMLSSVTPCAEPQASQGTCGPESLIGHTTATAGLGPDPITLPGQVFITGPYKGAPFGLSIVTPAIAGPFNLGLVIVRSTINVDPSTAAVTIVSDPLPLRIKGVPSQLQHVHVVVDRPNFEFNPTNCSPGMKVDATLTGAQGGSVNASSPFQVTGCDKLPFHPEFTAETSGETSKANGASLRINVRSSTGQANIGKTKVTFPIQLPSRLTTIQQACRDTVFEVNPAGCPEGSVIGRAIAHTPVLKNPLIGPAYLVSHGNAAFPDAEFVLQGEGITLILDGQTDIKKGITTSTFNSLPDAPVSSFEVELPRGPHSAFGATTNLCTPTTTVTKRKRVTIRVHKHVKHVIRRVTEVVPQPLTMPTILTGQNGNVIEKKTVIKVAGCKPKPKPKPKPKRHKKSRRTKH
jgi:hypothetical protein